MSISPDTQMFIETRAICLMNGKERNIYIEPSDALLKTMCDLLKPYADTITLYNQPPALENAWRTIANETGASHPHNINMDMQDIALIYNAATTYSAQAEKGIPDRASMDVILRARAVLRSQALPPQLRKLGEQAALAVAQPDFTKGSFVPSP